MLKFIRATRIGNQKSSSQFQRLYASVKTPNIDWNPIRTKKQLSQNIEFSGKTSKKVFLGLLCLAPIITFALGTWQVKRLKWKNKLIAECEDRLTYKPIPLPKNLTKDDLPHLEYRKVLVTGHFDYSREVFVGPRLHDGRKGYTLVCPFVQSNGSGDVLIDRGWISADKVIINERNLQHLSCPKGEITVECVVRVAPQKGVFNMDHEKGSRLYQYLDADAMAEELNTSQVYLQALQNFHDRPEWLNSQDLSETVDDANKKTNNWKFWKSSKNVDNTASDNISAKPTQTLDYDTAEEFDPLQFINAGVPLGKIPKVDYKNNHLNYLVTWYSLSVASTVLLIYLFKKGKFLNPTEEKLKYTRKIID
jgi:cytochrome oxidase assembly protein ShyY1